MTEQKKKNGAILGAAFLMATSAIGPGFLNNTSLFTQDLLTSFGFVILVSILLDIGAQMNIWRIVAVTGMRAQDIANSILPGLGYFLAGLIAFGGLAFNIGNMAGCGLGLNVLTGIDPRLGALISCLIALGIFWYREAGMMMDKVSRWLGMLMILLTIYIVFSSQPPLGRALYHTVLPEKVDLWKIITLVGGTVGGYISFAGAHRLLDAGIKGQGEIASINRSAVSGILITSLMRYLLFLAALGIVVTGLVLKKENPASTVFSAAAGNLGYKFFGLVLWSAAITSVVGASYTSISFWKTLVVSVKNKERYYISAFIIVSTILFVLLGNPVKLLVWAGALNGIILPLALAVMLVSATRKKIMQGYRHPLFLHIAGWLVVLIMAFMALYTLIKL